MVTDDEWNRMVSTMNFLKGEVMAVGALSMSLLNALGPGEHQHVLHVFDLQCDAAKIAIEELPDPEAMRAGFDQRVRSVQLYARASIPRGI